MLIASKYIYVSSIYILGQSGAYDEIENCVETHVFLQAAPATGCMTSWSR